MTDGPHHPFRMFGAPNTIVRCEGCWWAHELDECLHEDAPQGVLDWHIAHPHDAVDHLRPPGRNRRLAIRHTCAG
ncbi:hypothetical protein [Embleya sp. NPDC005575]|uniref:hypothetical protein n=1 Tax=Embleya sp. NPDC005575 TaxID=3156892 RepID=UPI0033AE4E9C